jgi:hypothetical protein
MNRFLFNGRCYMKESLIDFTSSNDKELDRIYGLFPHRNGPVCEDDIYDLDELTAAFIFKKAAEHEESCTTPVDAEPKMSFEP